MGEAINTIPSSNNEIQVFQKSIVFGPYNSGIPSNCYIALASFNYTELCMGAFLYHLHVNGMTITFTNYTQQIVLPTNIAYRFSVSPIIDNGISSNGINVQGKWASNSTTSIIQSGGNYTATLSELECTLPANRYTYLAFVFSAHSNLNISTPQNSIDVTAYYLK